MNFTKPNFSNYLPMQTETFNYPKTKNLLNHELNKDYPHF